MLMLTRNLGEKIVIADVIKIIVINLSDSQVKLGLEAPPSIAIYREEVYRRLQSSQLQTIETANHLQQP